TPVNQLVARAMLEKSGWSVRIVENGRDALEALSQDSFDVVILDCQMPVLDGFSAARAIRDMPEPVCRLPILAMTASALPEDRQRCLDAGMDEYLTKPINRASLDEAMERALASRAP
ncbi:MAG TPA: response regulator, partial [Acidimicrobiales bacterium]|nr:response regulator [Acidimicrobiales bacterium]